MTDPLSSLLPASHVLEPSELAGAVARRARDLGASETVLYLSDYEQSVLVPLRGEGVPERQRLSIEGTMAGRAFRRVEVVGSASGAADTGRGSRCWTASNAWESSRWCSPGNRTPTWRVASTPSSRWSPSCSSCGTSTPTSTPASAAGSP